MRSKVPGPESRSWLLRHRHVAAPMGPKPAQLKLPNGKLTLEPPRGLVFSRGYGSNVWDPDDNRFVDLAAGFGSVLIGHNHSYVKRAVELQSDRLFQAMGDLYPADAKIGLMQQLAALYPQAGAQMILGQSGADAVSAALKTAQLHTGRSGVIAFEGAYHGLSYGPLAACGLRSSYREPFARQLNPHVHFVPFPSTGDLTQIEQLLQTESIGALLLEPIQGRGGIRPLSSELLSRLRELSTQHGCLLIADEIWTGLGRSGHWLYSVAQGVVPDLVCLGKGLGGGLPISVCLGSRDVMQSWSQAEEVVHTSTFAGAPLACATALACLDVLRRQKLVQRASELGAWFKQRLQQELAEQPVEVRGEGLMLAIDLGARSGLASRLMFRLLSQGYISSTGGGQREVLVLTPALNIDQALLNDFAPVLNATLRQL